MGLAEGPSARPRQRRSPMGLAEGPSARPRQGQNPMGLAEVAPILDVRDIRVRYGAIEAVKGVSMTVGPGEIVTLIGGNGAGRTSTLKTLSCVLPTGSGAARCEGGHCDSFT